ncbi:MAG: cupin domain-containing protein [Polyangiaceae bacterium]|nr:cupin domain-containing protein [Polyangiaceae bacterium]
MAYTPLPFADLGWQAGGHPLELKKLVAGAGPVVLLAFEPGFEDPNVCVRGHVLYVVEGTLRLELDAGAVDVAAGEGCVLDPGTRHRAKNVGPGRVVSFVVSFEQPLG